MAPIPERTAGSVARSAPDALAEAERLLREDRPFQAHEVLEDEWKAQRDDGSPHAAVWQGLAQLAVGLTHLQRGNAIGAVTLLRRGAATIEPFTGAAPHAVPVDALAQWALELAVEIQAGSLPPASLAARPSIVGEG